VAVAVVVVTVDVNRAEWLEWRRHGIGASDVAGILGLSPWESPWSIWARKVGLTGEGDQSEAMEFGARAEKMLAGYYEDHTGMWIHGEQTRCHHVTETWMRASVDGFTGEAHSGSDSLEEMLGPVEFKCTGEPPSAWEGHLPTHYACQATWTAIVTAYPTVYFGVLHLAFGRPQFRTYEYSPTGDDIEIVTAKVRAFWFDHVLTGVPPAVDDSDATTRALGEAYPGDVALDALEADRELLVAWERIHANEQRIKDCAKVVDEAKNQVRAALGEHTALTHGTDDKGRPVVLATWKPGTRTSIDTTLLRNNEPAIAAKYSRAVDTRTLLIKTLKEKP